MAQTGERCTSSGLWRSACCRTTISRDHSEWFPVCRSCERGAWWELIHPVLSHPQRTIIPMETLNVSVLGKKFSDANEHIADETYIGDAPKNRHTRAGERRGTGSTGSLTTPHTNTFAAR